MSKRPQEFRKLNRSYNAVFQPNRLSVGLVVPIERYESAVPTMEAQVERIQLAEQLGFSAVWLRDVPFNVPSFGDAGQVYDPFVYLGLLSGQTTTIGLGVASIVLPLRHPAHVAKAAASVDVLSNGRLILGVASGDRPDEYPALNVPFAERGQRFRDGLNYVRNMSETSPTLDNPMGRARGIDLLPKPIGGRLPLLVTGHSGQSLDWIAAHGDGWMTYPRPPQLQAKVIDEWNQRVEANDHHAKPVLQPLYVDLVDDPDARLHPIHLGFRTGINSLRGHLRSLESIGVNHVALNLRFNRQPIKDTLQRLADDLLPEFSS